MQLPVDYNKLTQAERRQVREAYVKLQENKCYHCWSKLTGPPDKEIRDAYIDMRAFPPGFLSRPIHLHHCHDTGKTLGAVHARCNAHLWAYYGE